MATKYIWGRYVPNDTVEKIDQASSQKDADYLAGEYRMAFGRDWKIWAGRKKDEPGKESSGSRYV